MRDFWPEREGNQEEALKRYEKRRIFRVGRFRPNELLVDQLLGAKQAELGDRAK